MLAVREGGGVKDPAFTLLVCGGADYANRDRVFDVLSACLRKHPNITILHGARKTTKQPTKLCGVDGFAEEWALIHDRPFIGDPRGPVVLLAYLPHAVVAFEGAADMVRQARAAGLTPWLVDWEME